MRNYFCVCVCVCVSKRNCFNRDSLIGKFERIKWIKVFLSNSGLTSFKNYRLKVSETNIVLAEVYWSWKSYFCNRRCNFGILGGHVAIDLLKIDFTHWWSLMMVKVWLYKYSWKRVCSRNHIESLFFNLGISFLLIHVNSLTNILLLDFVASFLTRHGFAREVLLILQNLHLLLILLVSLDWNFLEWEQM